MASYLFPYQPQQIQPYQSPLQTYQQALAVKDFRFNKALSNIRSKYDSILGTNLTNEDNQISLRKGIDTAMESLSKMSVNDVSLPENQSVINKTFDSILEDQDLMYDAAWTSHYRREISKAEDMQKKNPDSVPPQNLRPLYKAQEAYRLGDKGSRPSPVSFTPFYDFDTKMNGNLDKIKADVDLIFSVQSNQVEGPDGKMHSVSTPLQYTVKQLKDYKIQQLAWNMINSDAQALNQMSLNYNYNKDNGFYPQDAAISGILNEMSTYQTVSDSLTKALNAGINFENKPLTGSERDTYTQRQKAVNAQLNNLQQLQNEVKLDPSASNKWFTFNKYIKDYVEGKANQYAHKEDSLISDVPGLSELTKYQLDVWKKQYDAIYDAQKEQAKANAKKNGVNGADDTPAPYNDIISRLDQNPGGIAATRDEIAALGQMNIDKDGRMFMDWSGNNTNPANTLVFTPAQGSFDRRQTEAVNGNVALSMLKNELSSLNIPTGQTYSKEMYYTPGGFMGSTANPYKTGADILNDYSKNPAASDKKIKAIVDKYTPVLKGYGVDPLDVSQRLKLESELDDPNIADAVTAGTTINLNGRFEVVPDQDLNLISDSFGRMYMKAKLVMPASKLKEGVKEQDRARVRELVSKWDILPSGGDEGDPYKKTNEQRWGVSVFIPVNGDVTQINDNLLKVQGYQDQWGKDAPANRAASRNKVLQFQDILNRSRNLVGVNPPYSKDSAGNYNPLAGPETAWGSGFNSTTVDQRRAQDQVNKIIQEVSTRTGQGYGQVANQINNIFGSIQSPLGRQVAIDNYIGGLGPVPTAAPGFRSFASYAEGRAALESQLDLYKTGKTKNNVGPDSTLLQAMSVYAPASDNNNPLAYAQTIANKLGISINTKISQIDTKAWADVIEIVEGNTKGNNPGNLRP